MNREQLTVNKEQSSCSQSNNVVSTRRLRTRFVLCSLFFVLCSLSLPAETRPHATFSYGATASWLTRIVKQTERSNFVFRDFLPGVYFSTEVQNIPVIVPVVRLAAYYPLVSTFNRVPQKPNTPLHIGADMIAGIKFEPFDFKYVRINAGPAVHLFYLSSDRWNYFNLGAAAIAGVELALSPGWTMLFDGYASLDSGNLGSNRLMEPFDITYQYQVGVGVRYSKMKRNDYVLFKPERDIKN